MANKKNEPEFTVTDRRRFVEDTAEDGPGKAEQADAPPTRTETKPEETAIPESRLQPAPEESQDLPGAAEARPTDAQRAESDRAYRESTVAMDDQIRQELGGQAFSEEFKTGFDRVIEPLYVTALVQMGFMGQEGNQRRVDIVGARQSIDAINLLQEKTKGNLTPAEAAMLEDVLYDLRMKYLEITNALARAVQNPPEGKAGKA